MENLAVKYGLVVLTAGLLSVGQLCIARFARAIAWGEGVSALIQSALHSPYFYLMFAVNGIATVGYIMLTRRYPLQEVFILNLLTMALLIALASQLFLGDSMSARRMAGYVLAVVAVALLWRA